MARWVEASVPLMYRLIGLPLPLKFLAIFILPLVALLAVYTPAVAQTPPLLYDEAEAQAIDRMLMCPVCPAENIDQARVEVARQMRQVVRERLAAGATRQEILDYFVDRYGASVLAQPPKSGFNLIAWVFPPALVAAALGALWLVLRAMVSRRPGAPATEPQINRELEPYLALVDQELARLDLGNPAFSRGSSAPVPPGDLGARKDG